MDYILSRYMLGLGNKHDGQGKSRLREVLRRSRERISGGGATDGAMLEEVEARLLSADVGVEACQGIITSLKARLGRQEAQPAALMDELREELLGIVAPCSLPLQVGSQRPFVILTVGVNGVGKTTTIGKLTAYFQGQGLEVMLAAGDTFRAAAVEQLQAWGARKGVPVVAQQAGADSASVIFDAWQSAQAKKADVLIADTAGRLHTQGGLMAELEKIVRVLQKQEARLPDEVLLVLDATTGQNAIKQVEAFLQAVPVSGLVLSKLDGSAKGGVVFAIAQRFGLPIRFIGVGEQEDDLRPFDAEEFVAALF